MFPFCHAYGSFFCSFANPYCDALGKCPLCFAFCAMGKNCRFKVEVLVADFVSYIIRTLKSVFCVFVLLLLNIASSCSDEESIYGRLSSDSLVPAITNGYISVSISANSNYEHTRADGPMGGEDGNGREDAFENEYQINNLTVLVYNGDINSSSATITKAFYFPYPLGAYADGESPVQKVYTFTQPIDDLEGIDEKVPYHLIAVCNAGDLSELEGKTLSVVRDHLIANVCTSERTDFVMSSENDKATITFDFSKSNIVEPTEPVVVERLAARIDFEQTNGTYHNAGYYEYTVDGTSGDKFHLRSIQVKNKLTSGTYLIKRVTTDTGINSTIKYLGDETEDATIDGKATNYVLDPWTKGKTSSTMPEGLTYESTDFLSVQPVIEGKDYFILDYTMENTLPVDAPLATYATALVFKGDYVAANGDTKEGVEYTYYIRHSDPENAVDAGSEVHCMKYGIVRNTIYRVKITKVNPMDVTTENADLSLQIKVKNWKKTGHAEIVM